MLNWMLYVIAASLLLARRTGRRARRPPAAPPRAGTGSSPSSPSLAIPTVIASVSIELPDIVGERAAEKISGRREQTTIPLEPQPALPGRTRPYRSRPHWPSRPG